jgi:hypothetical protein
MTMIQRLFSFVVIIASAIQLSSLHTCFAANDMQNLQDVSIAPPKTLGAWKMTTVSAYPLQYPTDTPEGADPEHSEFHFPKSKATLYVYAIKNSTSLDFRKKFPAFPAAIVDLRRLLNQKPHSPREIPRIPWGEGASNICAHVAYGSFANADINYIRACQFFQQDDSEITNEDLLYYAQGLSKDGRFYIAMVCPIHAPKLKDKPSSEHWTDKQWTQFSKTSTTYYANITRELEATTDSAFTPSLRDLDNALRSLTIKQTSNIHKE